MEAEVLPVEAQATQRILLPGEGGSDGHAGVLE